MNELAALVSPFGDFSLPAGRKEVVRTEAGSQQTPATGEAGKSGDYLFLGVFLLRTPCSPLYAPRSMLPKIPYPNIS